MAKGRLIRRPGRALRITELLPIFMKPADQVSPLVILRGAVVFETGASEAHIYQQLFGRLVGPV